MAEVGNDAYIDMSLGKIQPVALLYSVHHVSRVRHYFSIFL